MNEEDIEREIVAKDLNAIRLTPEAIDASIVGEAYHVFPGTTVTVCALTLRNGFVVIGKSASVSAENFDAEIGRKIARADARDQIWTLEGYLLRERLSAAPKAPGRAIAHRPSDAMESDPLCKWCTNAPAPGDSCCASCRRGQAEHSAAGGPDWARSGPFMASPVGSAWFEQPAVKAPDGHPAVAPPVVSVMFSRLPGDAS